MTYILILKENSFNNRFSTHRISLGMVYKSTFLLHFDRRWNYSIRHAGKTTKMTLNRQSCLRGANLAPRFSRTGRREPEVAGAPGFIIKS